MDPSPEQLGFCAAKTLATTSTAWCRAREPAPAQIPSENENQRGAASDQWAEKWGQENQGRFDCFLRLFFCPHFSVYVGRLSHYRLGLAAVLVIQPFA